MLRYWYQLLEKVCRRISESKDPRLHLDRSRRARSPCRPECRRRFEAWCHEGPSMNDVPYRNILTSRNILRRYYIVTTDKTRMVAQGWREERVLNPSQTIAYCKHGFAGSAAAWKRIVVGVFEPGSKHLTNPRSHHYFLLCARLPMNQDRKDAGVSTQLHKNAVVCHGYIQL